MIYRKVHVMHADPNKKCHMAFLWELRVNRSIFGFLFIEIVGCLYSFNGNYLEYFQIIFKFKQFYSLKSSPLIFFKV